MTNEQIKAMAKANAQAHADKKARDNAAGLLWAIGLFVIIAALVKIGVL